MKILNFKKKYKFQKPLDNLLLQAIMKRKNNIIKLLMKKKLKKLLQQKDFKKKFKKFKQKWNKLLHLNKIVKLKIQH